MCRRLLIAQCLLISALCAGESNLLVNGGFEDGWHVPAGYDARPEGWSVSGEWWGKYRVPDTSHSIPDGDPDGKRLHNGQWAWELSHINAGGEHTAFQMPRLFPGTYKLSGFVRTNSNQAGEEVFIEVAPEGQEPQRHYLRDLAPNTADYVKFEQSFETPGGRCRVALGVRRHPDRDQGYSPYTHWDDVSLELLRLGEGPLDCLDRDCDGWLDRLEPRLGTDPLDPDTDGDGIEDSRDPFPLKAQPAEVNLLKGDFERYRGKLPMTHMWMDIALRQGEAGARAVRQLADWGIFPAIGVGPSADGSPQPLYEEAQKLIEQGHEVTGWMCVHPSRALSGAYGLERENWDMTDEVTRVLFARHVAATAKSNPKIAHLSSLDENRWDCSRMRPEQFAAYLTAKGYHPGDFINAATSWDRVPMPDMTLPAPDDRRLLLLRREWQLFGEQVTLDFLAPMARLVRAVRPDIGINLGIFTPWSLHFGYYAGLPMLGLLRIPEADFVEFDWYEWMYSGAFVADKDTYLLEAAHQFTEDMLRKPLQLTFSMEFSCAGDNRDDTYYRLLPLCSLLQSDNVSGMTFYYYGCKVEGKSENVTIDHPRIGWLGPAIYRARQVYDTVHRFPELHEVLIVTDDPLHMGEGSLYDEKGDRRPFKQFAQRLKYGPSWYGRSAKVVTQAHRDARFCIPRMLPGLDLSRYHVIILDAQFIGDWPLARLTEWANAQGNLLLVREGAGTRDELNAPRDLASIMTAPAVELLPTDPETFAHSVRPYLHDAVYEPLELVEDVDIDVHTGPGGERVIVLANYSRQGRAFAFALTGTTARGTPLMGTAKLTSQHQRNGRLHVRGSIAPRELDVVTFGL